MINGRFKKNVVIHNSQLVFMIGITYLKYIDMISDFYSYIDLFSISCPSSLLHWVLPGHVLFWVSYIHVFCILVFVLV